MPASADAPARLGLDDEAEWRHPLWNVQGEAAEPTALLCLRVALSFIALCSFVGNFDASATPFPRSLPLAVLAAYGALNLALWVRPALFGGGLPGWLRFRLGVAVYAFLLASANQQEWILIPGLLLSVLALSTERGTSEGVHASVLAACALSASHLLFRYHGWALTAGWPPLTGLMVLFVGPTLAFLGGAVLRRTHRQSLLHGVGRFANPRFGVDETIGAMAERLRAFFDTDICVIVYTTADGHHLLHRSDRRSAGQIARAVALVEPVARRLLGFPADMPVMHDAETSRGRIARIARGLGLGRAGREASCPAAEDLDEVVEMFDAGAFISAPMNFCFLEKGRVYVIAKEGGRTFGEDDLGLLLDAVAAARPAIENVKLITHLATEAAEQERQRIARDLHDTTIQPFIGLMLGLSAVRDKIGKDPAGAAEDLSRLLKATEDELGDVRGYVRGLKDQRAEEYEFLAAVRRFVEKFQEASGIAVELNVEGEVRPNDRLAAETFQLIAEGLSNVRRHARATRASLDIACRAGYLHLLLRNDVAEGQRAAPFRPKSLSERTAALGGRIEVGDEGGNFTRIQISIPM